MFLYIPKDKEMQCEVYVKATDEYFTTEGRNAYLFVKNTSLIKFSIGAITALYGRDKWAITDRYFEQMEAEGAFIYIDDLRTAEFITEKNGRELASVDFEMCGLDL